MYQQSITLLMRKLYECLYPYFDIKRYIIHLILIIFQNLLNFMKNKLNNHNQKLRWVDINQIAYSLPDSDIPNDVSSLKQVWCYIVYTEWWCDRCFSNVIDEIWDDRESMMKYAKRKTTQILEWLPRLPQFYKKLDWYKLIEKKFIELPDNNLNYAVSIWVYWKV